MSKIFVREGDWAYINTNDGHITVDLKLNAEDKSLIKRIHDDIQDAIGELVDLGFGDYDSLLERLRVDVIALEEENG